MNRKELKGLPFDLTEEDMKFVCAVDILRTYQSIKMMLYKVLHKVELKNEVVSQVKSIFSLNFNKKQYLKPNAVGLKDVEKLKKIRSAFAKSQLLTDHLSYLRRLGHAHKEILDRLCIQDPVKKKKTQPDDGHNLHKIAVLGDTQFEAVTSDNWAKQKMDMPHHKKQHKLQNDLDLVVIRQPRPVAMPHKKIKPNNEAFEDHSAPDYSSLSGSRSESLE